MGNNKVTAKVKTEVKKKGGNKPPYTPKVKVFARPSFAKK